MPQAGEQIGPYTLIRQLGRGAFGVVWLAERRGAFATTQVALKLILDDEPDLQAIGQESQLWAQLGGHPNVLTIIEADKYGDHIVIVSEYVPDGTLNDWLKRHNGVAPSIESAVSMAIGILNGLEHLHSKKIIHRDLKPANILLQGETPRLADFGLARVLKSSMKSGGIAGTPAYMAPEVFDGERSAQSDLWSVGVILYQMLVGKLPFPQSDLMALLGAIIKNDAEVLPDYIPFSLAQVVAQSLQKNPAKRYQSVMEMRNALQNVASKGEIVPVTLRIVDEKPTVFVDTTKQTSAEETVESTMATLAQVPSSPLSKGNVNKTLEQSPARITQESFSQDFPSTEKIHLNKDDQLNNEKTLSKSEKPLIVYLAAFAIIFFVGGIAVYKEVLSNKKGEKETVVSNISNLPSPIPSVIPSPNNSTDNTTIKNNNKLAMEIGKMIGIIEVEISKIPKGKDKVKLEEAFQGIKDGFEESSSGEIAPENLKLIYESYFAGLKGLSSMLERAKGESSIKVEERASTNTINELPKVVQPSLPPSPNIPLPEQQQVLDPQLDKTLESGTNDIGQVKKSIPTNEDLKELIKMTRETRQFSKEAKRRVKEKLESLPLEDPPTPRRPFLDRVGKPPEKND